MMNEFTIEFEVKSTVRKENEYIKPIAEFHGNLEDGLKLLEQIQKKLGLINQLFP